jgi:substrate import-associated zinc metallohydrolase lipoprotein
MRKIYLYLVVSLVAFGFASCSDDNKADGPTIYPTDAPQRDAFDEWVLKNFTYPYNVEFQYKLKDIETDFGFTLVPADSAKSAKLAKLVKYLWFDAYNEVVGQDFVKSNTPRVITLIGCPGYENNGTMVLGTAEGGYKVVLYMVNNLTNETLRNYQVLTDYYFTTMHHEFMHILNQKIPYDPEFDRISESDYVSGDWYRQNTNTVALPKGFIRNYAMVEGREDYAETYSQYITNSDELWNSKLAIAGPTGSAIILRKLEMIRTYMRESWGLDIDELHKAVQHRALEMNTIDLETLN